MKCHHFALLLLLFTNCEQATEPETVNTTPLETAISQLRNYDSLAERQVMVVGTFHFSEEVLESGQQEGIATLIEQLKAYEPTKVMLEWEPHRFEATNDAYRRFLQDSFDISERYNEVFQLGFRLAKAMRHESVYLIDDQTDYPGSLADFATEGDPFSFDLFGTYAQQEDDGFYNAHEDSLIAIYGHNQEVLNELSVNNRIALLNSPEHQHTNAQRMHLYEMRVGIQKNWVGPDWVGRWYRRNIRMASNALKLSEKDDRLLVIVGDNHKFALDMLFDYTPDFELVSSWSYLQDAQE